MEDFRLLPLICINRPGVTAIEPTIRGHRAKRFDLDHGARLWTEIADRGFDVAQGEKCQAMNRWVSRQRYRVARQNHPTDIGAAFMRFQASIVFDLFRFMCELFVLDDVAKPGRVVVGP